MRNIDEIVLNKVILGIVDVEANSFMMGKGELELSESVYEYFEKHILKCLSNDLAYYARFATEQNNVRRWCQELIEDEGRIVEIGEKLTEHMYQCIKNSEKCDTEKSADLAVCIFEAQDGKYIGILKLDYNPAYTNLIQANEAEVNITLATDQKGLPTPSQKIGRAALISTVENQLFVTDRDLEGWFCQNFLNCERVMDERVNTKIIKEASEQFTRRLFKDNAPAAEEFRQRLSDTLVNEEHFNVDAFAERSFRTENEKEEYKNCLFSEGIKAQEVPIDRAWAEKKLKRKRLKVDKDIELYIDTEAYHDRDKFEIKRNGDGTIDIIIKNVKNYIEK